MTMPGSKPCALLADRGGDADAVRQTPLLQGVLAVIPPRSNRSERGACDFRRYQDRNRMECMFNRLKQFRGIATRYDKSAKSFLGFLHLAAAELWLLSFVDGTWSHSSSLSTRQSRCR